MFFAYSEFRQVQYSQSILCHHIFGVHPVDNHSDSRRVVGNRVDQDKGSRLFILLIRVKEQFFSGRKHNTGDLIQFHRQTIGSQLSVLNRQLLHCIDIHLITDTVHTCTGQVGRMLDIELFGHIHRFFIHPDQHRFEVTVFHRQIIRMYQHFATGNVDFVFQSNGNALGRESIIQFAIVSNDTFHFRCFA